MEILYVYECIYCGSKNHIHWEIKYNLNAPFCCECGEGEKTDQFKFIKKVEVSENDK